MSELPSSNGEEQPKIRYIDSTNVRGYGLHEGDVITNLDDQDSLRLFEDRIFTRMMSGVPVRYDLVSPADEYTPIKEELRPKRFHGKLINVQAIVLPGTDMDNMDPRHQHTLTMLLTADMKSTGRSDLIGSTSLHVTYKRRARTYGVARKVSRVKSGDQSRELMDSLTWESSAARHVLTEIALRQTVSAGLPSLGKDS